MANDILGINAFLALALQAARKTVEEGQKQQQAGVYRGIDSNNKPLYEVDGKVLTGNFSFNTGMARGQIVLGDTQGYVNAQAVLKKQTRVEETPDPIFYKDFFMVSRPDGSSGFIRIRTPRESTEGMTIDGGPVIDMVVISTPFAQGGLDRSNFNIDKQYGMFGGVYLSSWISQNDLITETYNFDGGSYSYEFNPGADLPLGETNYVVAPNNTAAYMGAGPNGPSLYRNGYSVMLTEPGQASASLRHKFDINSYQYNFLDKQYSVLFEEKTGAARFVPSVFERLVSSRDIWYQSPYVKRERGYHTGDIYVSSNLDNYQNVVMKVTVSGQLMLTNAANRSSAGPGIAVSPNGFNNGIGTGLWDIAESYDSFGSTWSGTQSIPYTVQRPGWTYPYHTRNSESGNVFIGTNADPNISGTEVYSYYIWKDRNSQGYFEDTGLELTPIRSNFGFGSFPGSYEGFITYRTDYDSTGAIHTISKSVSAGNYGPWSLVRTIHTGLNTPNIYITEYYHEGGSGSGNFTISKTNTICPINNNGMPLLIDTIHQGGASIHIDAFRWNSYNKWFFRDVFGRAEGDIRIMTPSFYGTAHCEVVHPNDYIVPTGFTPLPMLHPGTFTPVSTQIFTGLGTLEQYVDAGDRGIIGSEYVVSDRQASLIGEWSAVSSGYNLVTSYPPMLYLTNFIGKDKFNTYALAYTEEYEYFWPKVAVKLYGGEYWLGHPRNCRLTELGRQRVNAYNASIDADGNPINLPKPVDRAEYPSIWQGWGTPVPVSFSFNDHWIYSVKETEPYYDPNRGNDQELTNDKFVEWTTITVIYKEGPYGPVIDTFLIEFWYGKLDTFIADGSTPTVGTYIGMQGSGIDSLYDHSKDRWLLQTWDVNNPSNITFYNDTQYTYKQIVDTITEQYTEGGPLFGNIGLQVQYNFFTNCVYAMGFEKSTKKERPGVLVAGINRDNKLQVVFPSPGNGSSGQCGSVFLRFENPISSFMLVNSDPSHFIQMDSEGNTQRVDHRYCLTSVQEDMRGTVDQYFSKEVSQSLPSGGVINLNDWKITVTTY